MAKHVSTLDKLKKLRQLSESDVSEWEMGFIESMSRHYVAGTLGDISDKQIDTLEHIYRQHFA
jgi:hypothetical protein